MSSKTTILSRTFTVDRRRLIEAKTARECEALRQEILMLRAMQRGGRSGAGRLAPGGS